MTAWEKLRKRVQDAALPMAETDRLQRLMNDMQEVDETITASLYGGPSDGSKDRPPDGDDYNLLWDAVIAFIEARIDDAQKGK